jgi:predicted DNA-binding ribbon-helix-helix protein
MQQSGEYDVAIHSLPQRTAIPQRIPSSSGMVEGAMKSLVKKRTVAFGGRKTSMTLEEPFWNGLKEIARARGMTLPGVVEVIDATRMHENLSCAIRLFVLDTYRDQIAATEAKKSQSFLRP